MNLDELIDGYNTKWAGVALFYLFVLMKPSSKA
jgi:hypothetical protein